MHISEIRILPDTNPQSPVKAYASMVIDDWFVVRDIRIISSRGRLFVAMPNKERPTPSACGHRNPAGHRYCSVCGREIERTGTDRNESHYVDVAHPINRSAREHLEKAILDAFYQQESLDAMEETAVQAAHLLEQLESP